MKKLIVLGVICLLCTISVYSQSKKEWERVQSSNSWNVYQQFINNYPNGKYTELAKQKLAQLKEKEINTKKVETNKIDEVDPVEKDKVVIPTVKSQNNDPIVINKEADNPPDYYYSPNEGSISKGKITLKDGKSEKFKNLKIGNEIITFSNSKGQARQLQSSEVFKITKTGNYGAYGAISGALSGLLSGIQAQNDLNSVDDYFGQERSTDSSVIVAFTAGGAVFGGLLGMLFKSEKTVYKNNAALSIYPSANSVQGSNYYPMLSLKINLK